MSLIDALLNALANNHARMNKTLVAAKSPLAMAMSVSLMLSGDLKNGKVKVSYQ